MITYALVDPRDGKIKYVGITVNPSERLCSHISNACYDPLGDPPEENWKDGWLGALKSMHLKPAMLKLADGNFERTIYKFFKASGAKLLNKSVPPRRLLISDQRLFNKEPVQ